MPPNDPDFFAAAGALGEMQFNRAVELAERVRRRYPSDPDVLLLLAQALSRAERPGEAIAPLRRSVRARPEHNDARAELGFALSEAGKPDEALREFDTVLADEPAHLHAVYRRCAVLRNLGRADDAWAWLEPRLPDLPRVWAIAVAVAEVYPSDADPAVPIAFCRDVLAGQHVAQGDRRSVLYRLARWLDRAGEYDAAFAAAEHANAIGPAAGPNENRALLERCTPETLGAIEPSGVDASLAVLVCGMPRSGTTVTEQIIAAHPNAATVGESPELAGVVGEVLDRAERDGVVPRELSARLAKRYLKHLRAAASGADRVVDKMPQNFLFLGVVDRLLPGACVVRCVRDPRDTALSCFMQDFGGRHLYTTDLNAMAEEIAVQDEAAARWRDQTGLPIFESRLAQLVDAPETHVRELLEHVGLSWDDACLRFHEQEAHIRTASAAQIRAGLNTRGVGRWKHYESHLGVLIAKLGGLCETFVD